MDQPGAARGPRDHTVPILIASLGAIEVLVLYVLIAVETPLSPRVNRMMETSLGSALLVGIVVWVLCMGVAFVLWFRDRFTKGGDRSAGYEYVANAFIETRSQSDVGAAEVRDWARALPPGAEVLDVGCGNGVPITRALLDAGCTVWAVDASRRMVAEFRQRFPNVPVERAPAEHFNYYLRQFDGVVAWGVIFLMTPAVQEQALAQICGALRPGGQVLFTAPQPAVSWPDTLTAANSWSLGAAEYRRILAENRVDVVREFDDANENHYYVGIKSADQADRSDQADAHVAPSSA